MAVTDAEAGLSEVLPDEFHALISGCGLYQPDRAFISLTGSDRVRWLNGMVTNNVRDLAPGHGVYAFLLNPQGRIQADLYVWHRGDSLLVTTERGQAETVLQIFDRYIIMDDVNVEDVSGKFSAIEISGAKAGEVLAAVFLAQELGPLQFAELGWKGAQVTVMRGDNSAAPNYELWVSPEATDSLKSALLRAGAREIHAATFEAFRIASGVPKFGQDIRQRDLPQETAQERALSFSKGCYIGQEIVERIRSRGAVHRTFAGFEVRGPLPPAGAKIQSGGKDVGEITSIAAVPVASGEQAVALGYLRKEFLAGRELSAAGAMVSVVPLPLKAAFG
ncbi:MAG TPA: folate-binding protein [Terriglobales bacterium]|nr:folate-binding protein [Terriglobales bacterium]